MLRANFPRRREQLRVEAEARQKARHGRTDEEQLALLNDRRGFCAKERRRLGEAFDV